MIAIYVIFKFKDILLRIIWYRISCLSRINE